MQKTGLLNIGFGNFVAAWRVTAIVSPTSSPMRPVARRTPGRKNA